MELDFLGLVCPMPIIKLKKYLAENKGKTISVELLISDKSGLNDVPAFCEQFGLNCELISDGNVIRFKIQN